MKIEFQHWITGALLFECDAESLKIGLQLGVEKGASFDGANLYGADLYGANLGGADLRRANLGGANLYGADLTPIRDDFYAVLSAAPAEVPALIRALDEGKVNGTAYRDASGCGCLIGTLAIARNPNDMLCMSLNGLSGDSDRPAERFFYLIEKGSTPQNCEAAKIARDWAQEWLDRMRAAFAPKCVTVDGREYKAESACCVAV